MAAATSNTPRTLLLQAIEALGGGAVVLDDALRVAGATPAAERLLGARIPAGAHAVKVLCGGSAPGPLAEALALGRPVTGTLQAWRRPSTHAVLLRARPLHARGRRVGWLVLLTEEGALPDDRPEQLHGMWTRDPTMKRLFRVAERVAREGASVLIEGEMGTGKASLAAAIHALSPRRDGPFRVVACTLAPPVVERAIAAHLREADGGTLFLDDVTALPLAAQGWLLRTIESGVWTPPGGGTPAPVDVRVIAATSASLSHEVEADRFRADLMHRLRIVSLHLPPLRARRGDVELLADTFLAELGARGGRRVDRVAPAALARLAQHPFPGNVRELRAAVEAAFATGEGTVLSLGDLPPEIRDGPGAREASPLVAPAAAPGEGEADEGARIRRVIERAGGSRARAAALLGMSRSTLWRRMKALGLLPDGHAAGSRDRHMENAN